MSARQVATFCWIQAALAAVIVGFSFHSLATRPTAGFDYSKDVGRVVYVTEGGPAARAGIRRGDHIVSIGGHATGEEVYPFFFARAGIPVEVLLERSGERRRAVLVPVTQEQLRRTQLRFGGARAVQAITGYLSFPLHLWMLGLGAALLLLRPDHGDARLAAMVLSYWAGSMFMYRTPGFGVVLQELPEIVAWTLLLADAVFTAGFFAVCLHFALVFPSDRTESVGDPPRSRVRGPIALPYLLVVPIFIESLGGGVRRMRGDIGPIDIPLRDSYSAIGAAMLIAALAVLGWKYRRVADANSRRRLRLMFLALLPGSLAFVLGFIVAEIGAGYGVQLFARALHSPATMLGSGIFVYAVIRHRLFNIRVLVRRSVQYALARGTLTLLLAVPLVVLAMFLWIHRQEPLSAFLTGPPAVCLLLLIPVGLAMRYRRPLLEAVDRRFFREQYDARNLLLHVVSMVRGGSDMLLLSRSALDEIDRALHPRQVSLWQVDIAGEALRRGFHRGEAPTDSEALPVNGTLAALLAGDDEPLDVHSRQSRALLQRLPEAERDWLRGTAAHLLVPMLIERRLVGVMVLGERKSEEPYSAEDRQLLRMLCAQLALTLDYSRLKQSPSLVWSQGSAPAIHLHLSDVVHLCPRCGRCFPADMSRCETDGQGLVPESGVPHRIEEKYVLTRLLGRGGMGSVYLATQTRLNRPVAIKVLLSHLVGNPSMRSRFEREARIVARLRHPAVVTIHDFGMLPSGHAYLVMEHLEGETLRQTIAAGPLPLDAALPILRAAGDAVDAAHRAGVVHRDLKPENIMLVRDHDGSLFPRVLDFGLAKMTGPIGVDDQTLVQSGHSAGVVGTLLYMAPEVLSGQAAEPRSDQYSLALIAWELLAGEHPLGGATDLAAVVRGHTERIMMPIHDRIAAVPPNVSAAIDRALSKKAEERFGSVREMIGAMCA